MYGERITGMNDPPGGTMLYDRAIAIHQILDGTSQTIVLAEDSKFLDGQWINGRNIFDQAYPINRVPAFENDMAQRTPGGANAVLADGSARFFAETLELRILAALCTCAGHEVIDRSGY